MSAPPSVIVFDVNETLSDMSPMGRRFTDVGAPAHLAKLWFAALLRDGFALTAADASRAFADLGKDALRTVLQGPDRPRRAAELTASDRRRCGHGETARRHRGRETGHQLPARAQCGALDAVAGWEPTLMEVTEAGCGHRPSEVVHAGDGHTPLVAEQGLGWDAVLLVRHLSPNAFSRMVAGAEYPEITHLRNADSHRGRPASMI
jgi:hypothetical protein